MAAWLPACNDHAGVVRVLLDAWADVNAEDHRRTQAPLWAASRYGSAHAARVLLLQAKAQVDGRGILSRGGDAQHCGRRGRIIPNRLQVLLAGA